MSGGGTAHKVYVDGQHIRARSLRLKMNALEVPQAEIEILPHDIDVLGTYDIGFYLHPDSVQECAIGLKFALQTDEDVRGAFLASIRSALDEAKNYAANDEIAESILERIIGD